MVATRRGTCLSSSAKNTSDESEVTEPTSTIRRTRSRTVIVTTQTHAEHISDSHLDDTEEQNAASAEPANPPERKTRSSKRRLTDKQPDSTNEADVSESESCCSVVSDVQTASKVQPTPRDRRRTARERSTAAGKQDVTEVESHSLASVRTPRKSTRAQKKSVSVPGESTTSQEDDQSEAESCSSVASLSKGMGTRVVTRSRRTISVPPEETGHSEVESCSSTVSGPQGSTVRRSTRTRVKPTEPIPIHLEQSETPKPSSRPSKTRGQKAKATSADDDQAYDSEGCQSGPSLSPWRAAVSEAHAADSDSESISAVSMSVDSPSSLRGQVTPCSSRTGSASSNAVTRRNRFVRVTLDVLNVPSVVSKSTNKDVKEREVMSQAIPDGEESEEMEEEVNKTIISASQECSISEDAEADITLTLDQSISDADMEQSENGEQAGTGNDSVVMEESVEVVQKAHVLGQQPSVSPRKPKKSVTVTEKVVGKEQQSTDTIECIEIIEETSEPVVKSAMENMSSIQDDKEGSSFSSKAQESELSIQKSKPEKAVVSLLDSSEDEESDEERFSEEEGCKQAAVDIEIESEDEVSSDENEPGPSRPLDSPPGNGLFIIDTRPGFQPSEKYYIDSTHHIDDDIEDSKGVQDNDFVDEEGDDEEDEDSEVLFTSRKTAMTELSSSIDPGLKVKEMGGLYISFDGTKSKSVSNNLKKLKDQKNKDELLKKSVIGSDFEKKDAVPPYKESKRTAKMKRKEERAKTTGEGWFNMRAPELTEELKNDLKVLQMRSAMDPKRFYKKNDREGLPKYFQVGTVVDSPLDFYHSRIPKKQRKRTIVEELLADAEFRRYNKKKYQEIMTQKAAEAAGKMNKKHKSHKKR